MIIFLLKKLFGVLIGKLPEEQKKELWSKFLELLSVAIKSAAEGAVKK